VIATITRAFTRSAVGGAAEEEPRAEGRKGRRSAQNRSGGAAARHRQVGVAASPAFTARLQTTVPISGTRGTRLWCSEKRRAWRAL
jgi:hypothetical protein